MRPESRRKADRLNLIVNLLWKRPEGVNTGALARELQVTPRTIQRDLLDLQTDSYRVPLVREGDRWRLLPETRPLLSALRLTLNEATALALAARLLQQVSDETNPHVTAGLAKLIDVLPTPLGDHLQQFLEIGAGMDSAQFVATFEAFARSWAGRRTVHLTYHPVSSEDPLETDFDVYCLEPMGPSFAVYAIGWAHARDQLRTLKLERVTAVAPTDRPFTIRPDFDARSHLRSGWGIMGGSDLHEVRLRFRPDAVRRLRESRFHPSQEVADQPDGSALVTFRIAHLIEVVPFLRGWGPAVEVLAPPDLRDRIAAEARETARLYGARDGAHRLPGGARE